MSNSPIFALIDCNNFYASCERIFQPKLANKPIVVLSNNDGCIIARSNEAKDLGIEMGAPLFKFRDLIKQKKVAVFSSNYTLYGDISNRVMNSLAMMIPDLEIYSIDEAFLRLENIGFGDIFEICKDMRYKINKWLGIPTSIGIAPTKTLAKIANRIAKKNIDNLGINHVCDLRDLQLQLQVLAKTKIEDIWGIGKGLTQKLNSIGIFNGLELRNADSKLVRKIIGVIGERIVYELRGVSCISLEEIKSKKNILSSKSFGRNVFKKSDLHEAISNYAVRACQKMRFQKTKAQAIHVYIRTNPFSSTKQYCQGKTYSFTQPTNDVCEIIKSAIKIIDEIYLQGYAYKKAGIMLIDLVDENYLQYDLFSQSPSQTTSHLLSQNFSKNTSQNFEGNSRSEIIQQTMEKINQTFSKNSIFYAIQGTKRNWEMQCNQRSNHYTTNIDELVKIY
jgi:DNA polymerase V